MSQLFEYSILKYRTSYLLDERVNIGILFHFTNTPENLGQSIHSNNLIFVFPGRLNRISSFFPNLGKSNLPNIKRYLRAFAQRANELSQKKDLAEESLQQIASDEFIINDANSFFFSEVKQGFYSSQEEIVKYYEGKYFKYYEKSFTKKSQDALVKELFQQSIKKIANPNDERLKYFQEGIQIQNKITTSKFEFRWQNGTANIIKTLGFDLSDKQDIQDKAFKWTSAINYISEIEAYKNYHFDILVSRPTKKQLFDAYDKAIDVLSDISADIEIIEEKQIQNYAAKALETAKPLIL